MIKWFKQLLQIVRIYDAKQAEQTRKIEEALTSVQAMETRLRDLTTIDADISPMGRDANTVVVIGRLQDRTYFNTYDMGQRDFEAVVEHLKGLRRLGHLRHVDGPPTLRGVFEFDRL